MNCDVYVHGRLYATHTTKESLVRRILDGEFEVSTQIGDSDTITFRFEDGREESIVCADLFAVPD